jgi:hypothetical protein
MKGKLREPPSLETRVQGRTLLDRVSTLDREA